jgi:predicted nucleic-acid-binding protein
VIAVDTNVLVRLVTNDDRVQSPRAAELFIREDVFISKTVLLETEWVLRAAYELSSAAIRGAFERLTAVPSVTVEDSPAVARALTWYSAGMDFADALHLAGSGASTSFATFDRPLSKRAKKLETTPPTMLL